MDPIIMSAALQSLSTSGFRFVTNPPLLGNLGSRVVSPSEGRWPHGVDSLSMPISVYSRPPVLGQTFLQNRYELVQSLLRERGLRQELEARDRRIQHLIEKTRHLRQIRDSVDRLHIRLEYLERRLGLPQVSYPEQYVPRGPKMEELEQEPPVLEASAEV